MQIIRYHRVSTEDQSLQRQADATESYIGGEFDDPDITTYTDASTGTNTKREDYQSMMGDVEGGDVDVVVIKSISRISRSVRDLYETVDRLHEHGTALHIIDEHFKIEPDKNDPMQNAMWQFLGVFAEFEAEMTRKRIKEGIAARQNNEDYHHGPAPLGFRKQDGALIQETRFDKVVSVLEMVVKGNMSKRQAAKELETSRRTINRSIQDRGELYGLGDIEREDGDGEIEERLAELETKMEELSDG